MTHPATITTEHRPRLTRREQMAARAITRRIAASSAAAALSPDDVARYRKIRRLGLATVAPADMVANPNRGKRHDAPFTNGAHRDAMESARITAARRADLPVNVTEHRITKRGTMSKRATASYGAMRSDYR